MYIFPDFSCMPGRMCEYGRQALVGSQDHFMTYLVYTGILLDIFLHFDVGCCC